MNISESEKVIELERSLSGKRHILRNSWPAIQKHFTITNIIFLHF